MGSTCSPELLAQIPAEASWYVLDMNLTVLVSAVRSKEVRFPALLAYIVCVTGVVKADCHRVVQIVVLQTVHEPCTKTDGHLLAMVGWIDCLLVPWPHLVERASC